MIAVQTAYGKFGRGVEFFPNVEPDYGQVLVHARGNISLDEKNRLMARGREAGARISTASKLFTRASASSRAAWVR